jgi:hypothetical protein
MNPDSSGVGPACRAGPGWGTVWSLGITAAGWPCQLRSRPAGGTYPVQTIEYPKNDLRLMRSGRFAGRTPHKVQDFSKSNKKPGEETLRALLFQEPSRSPQLAFCTAWNRSAMRNPNASEMR